MKHIIQAMAVVFLLSCSAGKSLTRQYSGQPIGEIGEKFGSPVAVFDQESTKVYVYEIVKDLEGTEIHQGKLTLDPVLTPAVKKTERYYFTVKEDKILKVKFEEEYKR